MADIHRLLAPLFALVRQAMARVDYHALYPSRVVAQNADNSLDLKPDVDTFGPGLQNVPIRLGLPGVIANVKADSRVLLGFENGDATRPIATLWDTSTLDSLVITALTKITLNCPQVNLGDESGQPVARLGDIVTSALPPVIPVSGLVGGSPFTGIATIITPIVGTITASATKTNAS